MSISEKDSRALLEHIALQHAAELFTLDPRHGSRIARLPAGAWPPEILRGAQDVKVAHTPDELRQAMEDASVAVIFLPQEAIITEDLLHQICMQSPLNKSIIWETV